MTRPTNLLEQMSEIRVPPLPEDFDRSVHQRLNKRLLLEHLADLLFRGLPTAVAHFAQPWVGLLVYSLVGRFELEQPDQRETSEDRPE